MANTSEQHPGISRAAKRLILIVEDDTDIGPVISPGHHRSGPLPGRLSERGAFRRCPWLSTSHQNCFLLDYHLPGSHRDRPLRSPFRRRVVWKHVPAILMSADRLASRTGPLPEASRT